MNDIARAIKVQEPDNAVTWQNLTLEQHGILSTLPNLFRVRLFNRCDLSLMPGRMP